MSYAPEDIEAMTPAVRIEIQDFEMRRYEARQRRTQWALDHPAKVRWPSVQNFPRNCVRCGVPFTAHCANRALCGPCWVDRHRLTTNARAAVRRAATRVSL